MCLSLLKCRVWFISVLDTVFISFPHRGIGFDWIMFILSLSQGHWIMFLMVLHMFALNELCTQFIFITGNVLGTCHPLGCSTFLPFIWMWVWSQCRVLHRMNCKFPVCTMLHNRQSTVKPLVYFLFPNGMTQNTEIVTLTTWFIGPLQCT